MEGWWRWWRETKSHGWLKLDGFSPPRSGPRQANCLNQTEWRVLCCIVFATGQFSQP